MKKNPLLQCYFCLKDNLKTFNIKKTTTLVMLFCVLQMYASVGKAQNEIIVLSSKSNTIEKLLAEIEKQTDYLVVYSNNELNVKSSIVLSKKEAKVSEILNTLAKNNNLHYELTNNYIVISKNEGNDKQQAKKKLTGVIIDTKGEPIIGASIIEKNTTNGTITDLDGKFSLEVNPNSSVTITYIGYISQTINTATSSPVTVKLQEDLKTLDEVVVIGYGSTSTKKLVSSVTAIKGDAVQNLPYSTVTGALQGRATGVIVQQEGGEPGATPKISIRGAGEPVYVIDGVITTAWDFNMLNSNDIESLSILKDAASLAVYGSRAANGIVMVKTKQGKSGKTAITYSFDAQYNQPTMLPKKLDSYSYANIQNEAAKNDGYGDFYAYSKEELDKIKNQTDPFSYANTDWQKLGLKKFAPEYKHSLSMTGSSSNINYYLSLGMFNQGSLYTSDALTYDRYTVRSNVNTTFDKIGLTIGLNVNGAVEKKNYPSFSAGTIWDHLFSRSPLQPAFNQDGTFRAQTDHPLVEMDKRSGYDKTDGKFINVQMTADWNLPWVSGLSIGTMVNYRNEDTHLKKFSALAPQYHGDGRLYETTKPTLKETAKFGELYNFEISASYLKTFAEKHSVDAKFVFTASEDTGSEFWASRKDYLSTTVDQLFAGSTLGILNSGLATEGGRMGFVGRVKYDYAGKYYIEASGRYDGSDNFAPGYRWGFFPSIALAWDLTEEEFFKNLQLKEVNLLKLRGSYGVTGTEDGVNRFAYLPTYAMNKDEDLICIGGNLQPSFNEGDLVSPSQITWYTRRSLDYGIDFGFLNNRLKGSLDYFYYVTKGGLMSPADRYITPLGKKLPQIKSDSESRREGVDMVIRWSDNITKDLTYDLGFNMTVYNSKWVKKADESISTLKNPRKRETQADNFYKLGYIAEGLYQTEEQLLTAPRRSQATDLKLGDIMYKDVNGDGIIDEEDQVRIGSSSTPRLTYGFDFSFGYKGFTLSGLIYGTGARDLEMGHHYKTGEAKSLFDQSQEDYWREDNRNASFPRIATGASLNGSNNQQLSTFWLKDASFIRLRNLTLSYDLKRIVLKRQSWLSTCRLSITGANLFTISNVMDYFDPETAGTIGSYPVQRTYTFGLTVGF